MKECLGKRTAGEENVNERISIQHSTIFIRAVESNLSSHDGN